MDSISEFYGHIGQNFIGSSVLYIPSTLMRELAKMDNNDDMLGIIKYTDQVFILDSNCHSLLPEKDKLTARVMPKRTMLENNLFLLLRKKEEYLSTSFGFIFGKYCEHLVFYIWISEWLEANLEEHVGKVDGDTKRAFAKQHEALMNHKAELIKYFRDELDTLEYGVKQHFTRKVPNEREMKKGFEDIREMVRQKNASAGKSTAKKDKLTELKEFTKEYADELILNKVFKITKNRTRR